MRVRVQLERPGGSLRPVTYAISLAPDRDTTDASAPMSLGATNGLEEADSRSTVSDVLHAQWPHVVQRARALTGSVAVNEYPDHLELETNDPRALLWLWDGGGSVEVPYSYEGPQAWVAVERAYVLAALVADLTGLVAYDDEIGTAATRDHLPQAVARYGGFSAFADTLRRPPQST